MSNMFLSGNNLIAIDSWGIAAGPKAFPILTIDCLVLRFVLFRVLLWMRVFLIVSIQLVLRHACTMMVCPSSANVVVFLLTVLLLHNFPKGPSTRGEEVFYTQFDFRNSFSQLFRGGENGPLFLMNLSSPSWSWQLHYSIWCGGYWKLRKFLLIMYQSQKKNLWKQENF